MNQFRVVFEVEHDGNWLVRAPDIRGCHSYGRSLNEARNNIREALGLFVEGSSDIDLVEQRRLPRSARTAIQACLRARQDANTASDAAQRITAATARHLHQEIGLGVRDIGEILGISHQRVAQLLAGEAA